MKLLEFDQEQVMPVLEELVKNNKITTKIPLNNKRIIRNQVINCLINEGYLKQETSGRIRKVEYIPSINAEEILEEYNSLIKLKERFIELNEKYPITSSHTNQPNIKWKKKYKKGPH